VPRDTKRKDFQKSPKESHKNRVGECHNQRRLNAQPSGKEHTMAFPGQVNDLPVQKHKGKRISCGGLIQVTINRAKFINTMWLTRSWRQKKCATLFTGKGINPYAHEIPQ